MRTENIPDTFCGEINLYHVLCNVIFLSLLEKISGKCDWLSWWLPCWHSEVNPRGSQHTAYQHYGQWQIHGTIFCRKTARKWKKMNRGGGGGFQGSYLILRNFLATRRINFASVNIKNKENKTSQVCVNQWRIKDFPEEGAPNPRGEGGAKYDFAKFPKNCMKLKEFGPGGASLFCAPLRSATVFYCFTEIGGTGRFTVRRYKPHIYLKRKRFPKINLGVSSKPLLARGFLPEATQICLWINFPPVWLVSSQFPWQYWSIISTKTISATVSSFSEWKVPTTVFFGNSIQNGHNSW